MSNSVSRSFNQGRSRSLLLYKDGRRRYSISFTALASFFFLTLWAFFRLVVPKPSSISTPIPSSFASTSESYCRVELASSCHSKRSQQEQAFSSIYNDSAWGTREKSHTKSGWGSSIRGAFDTIENLEGLFTQLNVSSIADVPSGDCGKSSCSILLSVTTCHLS